MKKTLRQHRREKNLTQEELGEKCNITVRRLSQYENDVKELRKAKFETLEKIAMALEIETSQIYLG